MPSPTLELLAQVPSNPIFIQPLKLAAIAAGFALWAAFAQWVDKDTTVVNTFRTLWNLIVLPCGAVGAAVALLVPIFWVGFPIMLAVYLALIIAYVVHRNGLVQPEDTVLTAAHFRRIREEGLSGKKKKKVEVTERVRLTGHDRKWVPVPDDDEEREQYRVVQDILFDALWRRATLIELSPSKETVKVTYHVDGVPVDRDPLNRDEADRLLYFVKRIAGLNLEERRKPQQGQIIAAIGDNKHKVNVRTDGSTAGEKLGLRIWYNEESLKVPDLGFTPKQLEQVTSLREVTPGLILLSAPPACGLTTTIYSFMRTHDRFLQNVQSVEFEKEMDVDNVTQKVYSTTEGKTFTDVLLRLVRSDPDIIVLPEIRDRESAAIAAQAAAQKQKVYVGLVAQDVFDALRKWITLVGDKKLIARSLLAVANQRLVRVLCNECKQAYKPDAAMMRKLNLPADKPLYRPPEPEYDKHGNLIACQACQGTGYVGRIGVFDWLPVDEGLREVIRRSTSLADIQSYVTKKGGVGLQGHALEKVLAGVTSIQEVARAIRQSNGPPRRTAAKGAAAKPKAKTKPKSGGGQPSQSTKPSSGS